MATETPTVCIKGAIHASENLGVSPSEVSCCPEGDEITHRSDDLCHKGDQDNTITKHVIVCALC